MRIARKVLSHVLLYSVALLFAAPVLWLLILAIRPAAVTESNPLALIFMPDWNGFRYVFGSGGPGRTSLFASTVQSAAATSIAMPLAVMASYGLTRWRYRGQVSLGLAYFGLLLAPPIVFVIPLFVILADVNLTGSHWATIVAFQTFAIPMGILLLRSFFEDLPLEMEEAAKLDGCGPARILIQVFLPVLRPGLLVAGIFVFCFCWNNLLLAMPLTSGNTVPLTVRSLSFYATSGINWAYIGATAVIAMIVPMILFFIFRRNLVEGLTFGAVKE